MSYQDKLTIPVVDADRIFTVQNQFGIHARPWAALLECAKEFECTLYWFDEMNTWSRFGVPFLLEGTHKKGTKVQLGTVGKNAQPCLDAIAILFNEEFVEFDKHRVVQGNCS